MGRGGARTGAGRKIKGQSPRVAVCLTLEQAVLEQIGMLAEAEQLSLSEWVNQRLKERALVTASPVTASPVTASPVTASPVTASPVTASPVTASPVTASPVTASPVTASPVTASPVTASPVTASPVTASPVTASPVTASPVTASPVTASPVTASPVTASPVTASPVTASPVTASPVTASPVTASPVTASPVTASPVTASPTARSSRLVVPAEFRAVWNLRGANPTYPEVAVWHQNYRFDCRFREALELLCMNSSDEFKELVFERPIFVRPEEVIALATSPPGFRMFVLAGLLAGTSLERILSEAD